MKDFILAALPWILIGIAIAIICVSMNTHNVGKTKNYLTEGLCIGICFGLTLSFAIFISQALGTSLGMLLGVTIGIMIKKNPT